MVIVGVLLLVMVISSALVLSACMLAGQQNRELELIGGPTLEMSGRWSGTGFGGKYTTKVPCCSFEPEDLEEARVLRRF